MALIFSGLAYSCGVSPRATSFGSRFILHQVLMCVIICNNIPCVHSQCSSGWVRLSARGAACRADARLRVGLSKSQKEKLVLCREVCVLSRGVYIGDLCWDIIWRVHLRSFFHKTAPSRLGVDRIEPDQGKRRRKRGKKRFVAKSGL